MNLHVSYKAHKTPDIEKEIGHQVEKIQKRLLVFRPDLIHLKATIDESTPREGTVFSLNLRLPSGQMAAHANASAPITAVKTAFDELIHQLTRHMDRLRSHHKWRHWRSAETSDSTDAVRGNNADEVSLGENDGTLAAFLPPAISADDISSYVDANLPRLERFVERELYFRSSNGEITSEALITSEVVNEVIARALADHERPEKLSLEPWLYRLALQAMSEMTVRLQELESPNYVHLQDSRRRQNVEASDETVLQFHQPDESWTGEGTIADQRVSNPEQAAYSDEIIGLVQTALRAADRTDREAFLLYAIEGFSLVEIAGITGKHPDAVGDSVKRARECVRRAPAVVNEFRADVMHKTAS